MHMSSGATVWLTGLSGAGKTTICRLVEEKLAAAGLPVELLDGDVVRRQLCADLGFSREDRFRNIERVAYVAKLLTRNRVIVLASFISPYRSMRDYVRQEIAPFIEVYVKCSLEECIRRDVKGLYRKAINGEIAHFTGISDPYEEPGQPELVVDTEQETEEASAAKVVEYLIARGYIDARF
ncbi:adenylylsulfate kinase [Paenibacillus tyrfis]|uniref:Adenylyl-sulfate kinase n=2 Tax=Paenibacillus tyrfis TaxID=1501230 RepID=A0A081P5J8_9BACL|nr:adenylylsulfate kinase [Paenibacillus tyrfis]